MPIISATGGGSARGLGFAGGGGDQYFAYVTLLLTCSGVQGATTFTDSSILANTMTGHNGCIIDGLATYKFAPTSMKNRGNLGLNNYADCPANAGFAFGTGNFTVEAWVFYATSIFGPPDAGSAIFSTGVDSFVLGYGSVSTKLVFSGAGLPDSTGWTHGMVDTTWNLISAVRNGANRTIYVNGVSIGTAADASGVNYGGNVAGYAGALSSDPDNFNRSIRGYQQDLRVTKGIARYTGNFTPPVVPFPTS